MDKREIEELVLEIKENDKNNNLLRKKLREIEKEKERIKEELYSYKYKIGQKVYWLIQDLDIIVVNEIIKCLNGNYELDYDEGTDYTQYKIIHETEIFLTLEEIEDFTKRCYDKTCNNTIKKAYEEFNN